MLNFEESQTSMPKFKTTKFVLKNKKLDDYINIYYALYIKCYNCMRFKGVS